MMGEHRIILFKLDVEDLEAMLARDEYEDLVVRESN